MISFTQIFFSPIFGPSSPTLTYFVLHELFWLLQSWLWTTTWPFHILVELIDISQPKGQIHSPEQIFLMTINFVLDLAVAANTTQLHSTHAKASHHPSNSLAVSAICHFNMVTRYTNMETLTENNFTRKLSEYIVSFNPDIYFVSNKSASNSHRQSRLLTNGSIYNTIFRHPSRIFL